MRLRNFRAGWRALLQEPAYALVVVLGLGVGFAACLLLLGLVRYSWQYDAHVPHARQVYVVKVRHNITPAAPWLDQAPLLLGPAARKVAGVAAAASYLPSRPHVLSDGKLTVRVGDQLRQVFSLTVGPGFADMLGLRPLHGSLAGALEQPDSLVLTDEAALRLFGAPNALGRTMLVEGKLLRVGAVVRTPPPNTTIPFEALIGVNSVLAGADLRDEMLGGAQGWMGKILVRVHPDASLSAITAALQQALERAPGVQKIEPELRARLGRGKAMDVALSPLRAAYFDHALGGNFIAAPGERADPAVVAALGATGVLILALAALNYVNLATVRVLRRQREVAMRKVLGASVRQIVLQFLVESMLVSMVATALGLLLAWLALPLFSALVERRLDAMLSVGNAVAALAIGLVLGVLTAAYPAWIALRVRPAEVLAGRPNGESVGAMRLRRAMTVLQVAAAMGLTGVTLAVAWQTGFATRASPGFDPAPLLIVDLPEQVHESAAVRAFIAALAAQPEVAGIALSLDAVGRTNESWSRVMKRPGGAGVAMDMKSVSANFFEQYRIAPHAGRLFAARVDTDGDPVPLVLNGLAARELGFATPEAALGQTVLFTGFDNKLVQKRVVGIAPDLRFHSLREPVRATAYELRITGSTLSVRAAHSPLRAEQAVRALWPRYFPDAIVKVQRADAVFAAIYAQEGRVATLLALASAIALLIAALGTYVLAAHTVQRRATEIALRKLHGARRRDVGWLVVREMGALLLLSAAIGLPLAAVAIERYLAVYVERAPIGYWTLLFAFATMFAIALAAVARNGWIAMRMMPYQALRA